MEKSLIEQVGEPHARRAIRRQVRGSKLFVDELAPWPGWIPPSSQSRKNSTLTSTWIAAPATATPRVGPRQQPGIGEQLVEVQQDLDKVKFYNEYVELLTRPLPARATKETVLSDVAAAPIQLFLPSVRSVSSSSVLSVLIFFPGFLWRGSSSEGSLVIGV